MRISRSKKILLFILYLLLSGMIVVFFVFQVNRIISTSNAQQFSSSDAIAVKIISNPEHLSALEWYKKKDFKGSPQSIMVDGYRGVREGRTVYVNAANISDNGTPADPSDDELYTNIYLISYNQKAENPTRDIFARILKNWKFNLNVEDSDVCSDNPGTICRGDADCPSDDYCLSRKAIITRDTIRLEDMTEIESALADFRSDNGHYPKLAAGSYLPHRTLSVWPSWQKLFAQYLGGKLPADPINRLGDCGDPRFNPQTCWDAAEHELSPAINLDDFVFPPGSRLYYYSTNESGTDIDYCVILESSYSNISEYNCMESAANRPPVFDGSSMSGSTKEEFNGYLSAYDPDGDELSWEINLHNPANPDVWESSHLWEWDPGESGFTVSDTGVSTQKHLHAAMAGNANQAGDYQIEVVLNDGQGQANSEISRIVNVIIAPVAMQLNSADSTFFIGQEDVLHFSGTDMSMNPLTQLDFESAIYRNNSSESSLSLSELNNRGFSLSGMDINADYTPGQMTGVYTINVSSRDPVFTDERIESQARVEVINNPPEIHSFQANYSNGTSQSCPRSGGGCQFRIDNQEQATVNVSATDPDPGHNVSYTLVDAPSELSIDSSSGLIAGFENLNELELEATEYTVRVRAEDQYCAQSGDPEAECRDEWLFNLEVMPYCGSLVSDSYQSYVYPGEFLTVESPNNPQAQVLDLENSPEGCSEVETGTVDISIEGESNDKLIVFVVDLSLSMDEVPPGAASTAIELLIEKLAGSADEETDVFNILNSAANAAGSSGNTVEVAFVTFNDTAYVWGVNGSDTTYNESMGISDNYFFDIAATDNLNTLKNIVNNELHTGEETNILDGLNMAELLLEHVDNANSDMDKTVVLLSDGEPQIEIFCSYQNCRDFCNSSGPDCGCSTGGGGNTVGFAPPESKRQPEEADSPDFQIAITDPHYSGSSMCNECPPWEYNGECDYACVEDPYNPDPSIPKDECCTYHDVGVVHSYPQCFIDNIDVQADIIKDTSGLSSNLFTIYYNTGGNNPQQSANDMCFWSSENNDICDPYDSGAHEYSYAFASSDIDSLFDEVIRGIFNKPQEVIANGFSVEDTSPMEVITEKTLCINDNANTECAENISNVDCGLDEFSAEYEDGSGEVIFSNLNINYCPATLH